jgi:hypothetical protein
LKRRVRLLLSPVIALLVLVAGASAYLHASGSGSGAGSASVSLQPVSIVAAATSQSLLPTGTAIGDVAATISNPNASGVHISSLSLDTTQGTGGFSANAASCALTFAVQANGGAGWTVAANGQRTIDLTSSLTMGTAAANACQGQTFTVYLKTP